MNKRILVILTAVAAIALFVLIIRARHNARYPYETSIRGAVK